MSFLDDQDSEISSFMQEPLQPVPVVRTDSKKTKQRALPPDVLIRVFQHLPVSSLVNVALVSRRFKVLVYDDEIWDAKLRIMLRHDTGALKEILANYKANSPLMDREETLFINNKPLNALIPGLSTDPYNARARAKSTGEAREQFMALYTKLIPYYVGLRERHKESKILEDFGSKPEECGRTLNMLVGFGNCHVVDDWKQVKKSAGFFDSADAKTSPSDLTPFKTFISVVTEEFKQQSQLVSEVFDECADVYYMFADRVFEDVIAEYVGQLLGKAQSKDERLYLHTISHILEAIYELVDVLTDEGLPRRIDRDRGINLLFKLFLPFLDDYLYEEKLYVENACAQQIEEWNNSSGARRDDSTTRLSNQSRETFKRNYLSAFKKVIALPVDLVSSAATTIASPFQRSSTFSNKTDDSAGRRASIAATESSTIDSPQSTPPSTPKSSITLSRHGKNSSVHSQSKSTTDRQSVNSLESSKHSLKSPTASSPDFKNTDVKYALEDAQHELDMLQNLLSLEVALQLIHVNKDSERRVQRFIRIGFPGRMKSEIQRVYEQIFIRLLKTLGNLHIKPAFDRASEHLSTYKPDTESLKQNSGDVPPLTEFFELVHVADVIQQMIQLYYDEEITKYVDKHDFMNEVNKEKKSFERILDDCVARGMDRGIQVLLSQVELILSTKQRPEDYNPQRDVIVDLKPTNACRDTIQCLKTNTSMLFGAAEKSTMDLFFSEIGRRFFEALCKHLKSQTVNEQGGFRYISDMNAYYDFITTLRQKSVTPYFTALKSLANLYIISSPQDIKNVIHDLERYNGLMRVEDMFEFAACRSDWPMVRKVVQKDMTDCVVM
ncbi:F-box protein: endocytic membrane traffic, recycling ReCYcling 1 [Apophysomyces ossiformis]|uniref:F-box protein: endocytic membrane traffic, recycling ReCYcling 1 n=1 Tax=Apophysomyces ossiformis TaxID=679940 RepID=A0A8H7EQB0_9FUNG|nr:F-box protein: endocytic membrane traffic, recycling ReCYcling 1 [Apophysomyces ossiformis]